MLMNLLCGCSAPEIGARDESFGEAPKGLKDGRDVALIEVLTRQVVRQMTIDFVREVYQVVVERQVKKQTAIARLWDAIPEKYVPKKSFWDIEKVVLVYQPTFFDRLGMKCRRAKYYLVKKKWMADGE